MNHEQKNGIPTEIRGKTKLGQLEHALHTIQGRIGKVDERESPLVSSEENPRTKHTK